MKKILYSLLFIFTVIFTACEEDLPKASFDLYELKSLCLLYTSPSPRDVEESRMPSSA